MAAFYGESAIVEAGNERAKKSAMLDAGNERAKKCHGRTSPWKLGPVD